MVHLVNVYSDKLEELCEWDALRDVSVRVDRRFLERARGGAWTQVYLAPGRRSLAVREDGDWIEFAIPRLDLHEIVVFE
jgi:hypothetical protein